jgi:transcriptional regulator GlxA family with amidase domain
VLGYVDQLDEELQARAPGFGFLATAAFMQIVGFLSRCYSRSKNPDSRALLRIAEAITHLEKQYRETMDLDELARIAHMSKRSFLRTFKAATNSSPIAYLIQVRLNQAMRLLRQSNQSITDIAFLVGFNDSNYFSRQFAKTTGMSPRVYRQQCKTSG